MEQAFVDERAIGTRLLEQIIAAALPALPIIASRTVPDLPAPFDSSVLLLERSHGEKLFLSESGAFFAYDPVEGPEQLSAGEVFRGRWSIREMVLAIAEEMCANLEGQEKKTKDVERVARKMRAVVELLEPVR
jgi:hypothetical protein